MTISPSKFKPRNQEETRQPSLPEAVVQTKEQKRLILETDHPRKSQEDFPTKTQTWALRSNMTWTDKMITWLAETNQINKCKFKIKIINDFNIGNPIRIEVGFLMTKMPRTFHSVRYMGVMKPQQSSSCISMTLRTTSSCHHSSQTKFAQQANLRAKVKELQICFHMMDEIVKFKKNVKNC